MDTKEPHIYNKIKTKAKIICAKGSADGVKIALIIVEPIITNLNNSSIFRPEIIFNKLKIT